MLKAIGHLRLNIKTRNKTYELLLLKIAIGKSYFLSSMNIVKENYKLSYGFDSIYYYD